MQDKYWCVPPEAPFWWFIEGDDLTDDLCELLSQCLDRITYFGRAGTLTRVRVAGSTDEISQANCSYMTGKYASGDALRGHRHTEFLTLCENDQPTRLLVGRGSRAFDADE